MENLSEKTKEILGLTTILELSVAPLFTMEEDFIKSSLSNSFFMVLSSNKIEWDEIIINSEDNWYKIKILYHSFEDVLKLFIEPRVLESGYIIHLTSSNLISGYARRLLPYFLLSLTDGKINSELVVYK